MAVVWKLTGSLYPLGTVASLSLTNGGSGYTSAPTVAFSGGGGTGAAATAVLARVIASLSLTNGGSGYTSAPSVAFSGGGGSGAAATATLATSGGFASVSVLNGGTGWVTGNTIAFTGDGSGATASVVASGGVVTAVNITNPGTGYTAYAGYTVTSGSPTGGLTLSALIGKAIASLSLSNGGSGYTSTPTVSLSGGGGTGGAATAVMGAGVVSALTLNNPGEGYGSAPSVSFSGGGGTGAAATATLAGLDFDEVDIATLGIVGLTRTRRNMAPDELTFRVEGRAIDAASLFGYGSTLTIIREEDEVPETWFVGRVVELPRRGTDSGESHRYRVAGPWWYFENLVYQQLWPLDPTANSHLSSPETYRRALAIVGLASDTGLRQDTKAFLVDVLDWLVESADPAVIQYEETELPAGFDVPFQRLDAPTCAEAVRALTRWMPDAVLWWDYTESPPKLNVHRRAGADTISLEIGGSAYQVRAAEIGPRHDLKLDHLLIQLVTLDANGNVVLNEDADPEGTTGREWGAAVFTIDNRYRSLTAGLAAEFRAGLSTLQWAGEVVIEEQECARSVRPGHLLNLTGGASDWATMAAQVQEVTEEVDAGRTTLRLGPPTHIRLDDLVEVLRIARGQVDETGSGEVLKTGKQGSVKALAVDLDPAGNTPTAAEFKAALEDAYSGGLIPYPGDTVDITVDDVLRYSAFIYTYVSPVAESGVVVVKFTVTIEGVGVDFWARIYKTGALRRISSALTMAGDVPTATEIADAVEAAFASTARPQDGDVVVITLSGTAMFEAKIDSTASSASGLYVVGATIGGITYYATVSQVGLFGL